MMDQVKKTFEKIPFADREIDGWNKGSEKDTDLEYEIAWLLKGWTAVSGKNIANKLKSYERLFQAAKKKFPNTFQPPLGKKVYRGLGLNDKKYKEIINNYAFSDIKYQSYPVKISQKLFNYEGNKPVDSWSMKFSEAARFSSRRLQNQIVLETIVDNSFIFNPKFMDKIYAKESEILSFKQNRKVRLYLIQ